jgi:hypothetical protein
MKFYLYYNDGTGEIKAISPIQSNEFKDYALTRIEPKVAHKFMTGELDPIHWFVGSDTTEDNCVLTNTQFDISSKPSDVIEEIQLAVSGLQNPSAINVTVYTKSKQVKISVPATAAKMDMKRLREDTMSFYISKRNDPSHVYAIITCKIDELFEKGSMTFDVKTLVGDFQVYTRKIFRSYELTIRRSSSMQDIGNRRSNKLRNYQRYQQINEDYLLATHQPSDNTLTISLMGDKQDLNTSGTDSAILFLTKPNDPTVLESTVRFNWTQIDSNRPVVIKLPDTVGTSFGICSFPYTDNLLFIRK